MFRVSVVALQAVSVSPRVGARSIACLGVLRVRKIVSAVPGLSLMPLSAKNTGGGLGVLPTPAPTNRIVSFLPLM